MTVIGWMSLANNVSVCRLPLSSIEKSSRDKSGTRRPRALVTVAYTATVRVEATNEGGWVCGAAMATLTDAVRSTATRPNVRLM